MVPRNSVFYVHGGVVVVVREIGMLMSLISVVVYTIGGPDTQFVLRVAVARWKERRARARWRAEIADCTRASSTTMAVGL